MSDRFLRRPEVEAKTGLKRSTIYEMKSRNAFPQPVRLGVRAVAWRESDILRWMESRAGTGPDLPVTEAGHGDR